MAADPRIEQYARILVEDCVDVQPGWQVLVRSQPLGRPLVDEVCRQIARRGAYAILRLSYSSTFLNDPWVKEAPEELLQEVPPIEASAVDECDCFVAIVAPENTREGMDIPPERFGMLQAAMRPHVEPFFSLKKKGSAANTPRPLWPRTRA